MGHGLDDEKTLMDALPGGTTVPPIEVVLDRVTHDAAILQPAGSGAPPIVLLKRHHSHA